MERVDNIIVGFLGSLILPVIFIWLYLYNFYPNDINFFDSVKELWGSRLFGKLLFLSIIPDLLLTFGFYKFDKFKSGAGAILGMIPYLITSIFMFN